MKLKIEWLVTQCGVCQRCKNMGKEKYGKLLLKDDNSPEPFKLIAVDLVGLWKIKFPKPWRTSQARVDQARV